MGVEQALDLGAQLRIAAARLLADRRRAPRATRSAIAWPKMLLTSAPAVHEMYLPRILSIIQCDNGAPDCQRSRVSLRAISLRPAASVPRSIAGRARRGRRPSRGTPCARDMPRTSAACSMVRPAKKRSLTSWAVWASRSASVVRASSRASRSSDGQLHGQVQGVQVDASAGRRRACPGLAAGVFDEDAAHGLGRGGEEMAAAVPARAPAPRPTSRR